MRAEAPTPRASRVPFLLDHSRRRVHVTAIPELEAVPGEVDPDEDIVHTVCTGCLLDHRRLLLSFCGMDMTDQREVPDADYGPAECAMCIEITSQPTWRCPGCGMEWRNL